MAYFTRLTKVGSLGLLLMVGCGSQTSILDDPRPAAAGNSAGASAAAEIAAAGSGAAMPSTVGNGSGAMPQSGGSAGTPSSDAGTGSAVVQSTGGASNSTFAGATSSATTLKPPMGGAGGVSTVANAGSPTITTPAFDGIPAVGTRVAVSAVGATGTVTSVSSESNGVWLVFVQYDSEWSCPSSATSDARSRIYEPPPLPSTDDSVGLAATDCHSLAALRRTALKAQNLAALADQRDQLIASKCSQSYEHWCIDASGNRIDDITCRSNWDLTDDPPPGNTIDPPPGNTADPPADDGSSASTYSTTNVQVANVEEPDYVKNDGNTIYVLGSDGLHVVDAWPATETHEIARLAIPGEPRRLLLDEHRLVVYSRIAVSPITGAVSLNPSDQGCTYGYGCRFTSDGGSTLVLVFDVTTPAQPIELMRYTISGGFVAARRVADTVYTVVHDAGAPRVPGTDLTLQADSFEGLEVAFAARAAENDALTDARSDEWFLPWVQTAPAAGVVSTDSSCTQGLAQAAARGGSFVSLDAFSLTEFRPPKRMVMGANPGFVYASTDALYLAVDQAPEPTSAYSDYAASNSVIHKFALAGLDVSYRGSSKLPGHILNQFAMDERDGVLRVASTAGWVPDPKVVSYLTTFTESSGVLTQLGQVGGIAPTEDIRSVRFDEDRGFVVTFKKTDPLFVFDLSNPAAPRQLGELKIPGFSTYLHRLDANHLLAVGFEADDHGSYAYFNGIQIQIFDVTDLTQPALLWKHVIGTRGSGSEALTNHLAFNYFAPKKLLALPITVCEGGGDGQFGTNLTFAGLMTFDISLESGITEHGRLPFVDPAAPTVLQSCSNWWTDATSLVKRSIFMGDWVYGLSDAQLRVANLASMTTPVATVGIGK